MTPKVGQKFESKKLESQKFGVAAVAKKLSDLSVKGQKMFPKIWKGINVRDVRKKVEGRVST